MIIKMCRFKKCQRQYYGRGYCKMHWLRWRKWGDASVVKYHLKTPELIKAQLKRCPICRKIKSYSEFNKNKSTIDNYQDNCRECIRKYNLRIKKKFNGLYATWQSMKKRCYNSKCNTYKYYGAKGITICEEWRDSFQAFYSWAKSKHKKGLTIDRKNNDGNYTPENCRFVTHLENMRNNSFTKLNIEKVNTIRLLLKNRTLTFKEIGKRFGVTDSTIRSIYHKRTWR